MVTKESVEQFLLNKCGEYKLECFEYESSEKFKVIIKCKLGEYSNEDYSGYCKSLIEKCSTFSNTNWIVRSTFPQLKRLAFRKVYKCQHSSFNKNSTSRLNRTRSRDCDATIDIKIKKVNRNTCKNDADLKEGYTVLLKINYSHSHLINVAEAYSKLRCTEETNDCFQKYFESGMSPAAAIASHELALIEKYGKDTVHLANSQINPNERHVYYLYAKWRKLHFGDRSGLNIDEVLESKLSELETKAEECKYKWRNIRDNHRKHELKKKTGSASINSKYDAERLNFLINDSSDETEPISYVNVANDLDNEVVEDEDEVEDSPIEEQAPSTSSIPISSCESIPQQPNRQITEPGNTPVHLFFRSMADVVSQFPPDKIAVIRAQVCNIVTEMELSVLAQQETQSPQQSITNKEPKRHTARQHNNKRKKLE